jgi:hypothetical protein
MLVRLPGPLAALLVVACTSSSETATGVVERFYATTIAQKVTGAPTAAQLATLAPFLSDTLRMLLEAARRRSEADAARAPDEKPMFVEGDLFSSLFEGPNAVEIVADSARGDGRVATVRMTATSASPPVTWTDRVVLVKRAGRFVIDDIEYAGTWDFANKGGLRASLVSGLATPP